MCTVCLLLPDFLPDFPLRWPYHGVPEPEWLRVLLEAPLFGEREPAVPRPAPAAPTFYQGRSCADCNASLPDPRWPAAKALYGLPGCRPSPSGRQGGGGVDDSELCRAGGLAATLEDARDVAAQRPP
jgi:hypothetical protein